MVTYEDFNGVFSADVTVPKTAHLRQFAKCPSRLLGPDQTLMFDRCFRCRFSSSSTDGKAPLDGSAREIPVKVGTTSALETEKKPELAANASNDKILPSPPTESVSEIIVKGK